MVGTALIQMLTEKGYKVIVLSRNPVKKSGHPLISYALWDVKKQTIDIGAIQAADYIIHLAGAGVVAKKWTAAYKAEILNSRTMSSKLLVDALKNNPNKVKAVVSASAIGWYGADNNRNQSFTESDPADDSFLGNTCKLWEQSIELVEHLNIRLVKLRLGIVLSNKGGALTEFRKPLKLGVAAILGDGKQVVSWIHIHDLCNIFIEAIENEHLTGTYNAVAPYPVTNKTLTLTLAKILHTNFYLTVNVPVFILNLMMGERSIEVLKSTTVSSNKIEKAGFTFSYPTIEKALKQINGVI